MVAREQYPQLVPDPPELMSEEYVASLTPEQRVLRVGRLIEYSHAVLSAAIEYESGRQWTVRKDPSDPASRFSVLATVVLFSGGNDSTVMAHLFKERAQFAAHANTTIGVEQTRQFVRDTCAAWGLPLLERTAPISYDELVLEQGFPGPAHHWKMYSRLKERALRLVRKELVAHPRRERIVFLAGRRRTESQRRMDVPEVEREGSVLWVSPMVYWTKLDMNTYRSLFAGTGDEVPHNEVTDLLHMSGECLCGSFAKPNELDEISLWFPEVAEHIRELEKKVEALGTHPPARCRWGSRDGKPTARVGQLCSSCTFTTEEE